MFPNLRDRLKIHHNTAKRGIMEIEKGDFRITFWNQGGIDTYF